MRRKMKSCCSRSPIDRLLGLALALSLLPLAGCDGPGEETDTLRIGMAVYAQEDTFISTVSQELERCIRETEAAEGRTITLVTADGRNSQAVQLDKIDNFLDQECDVLLVNIVDRTAAAVIADKAEKAGVPLIFFNRQPVAEDIRRWDHIYYVGANAQEGGAIQGKLVLDAWNTRREELDRNGDGVLQYVMLEGEQGHQDTLLRTEYSIKALTDAGVEVEKLASGTANWYRSQAAGKTAQWIAQFGDRIEVVFSNNDDMALGAIDAYHEAGRDLPLVVGVDATPPALESLKDGELYGTVRNDAAGIAQAMLDLSLTLSDGEDPADTMELTDGHYVWLPYRALTRESEELGEVRS